MATILIIVGWILFATVIVVGLALDLIGLFGNWLILASVVVAWILTGFNHFGLWTILILTGLAVIGEIIEALAAGLGARTFGAQKGAIISAIAGGLAGSIVGTAVFPIIGTIVGACIGAFVVVVGYQYIVVEKQVHEALWTGFGAMIGLVCGRIGKFLIGIIMLAAAALGY